jgi:non-specific serine/threonine protein kinase/serine/threonine-protein kinase
VTPQTWKEIDSIVAGALALPEGQRTAYLEKACAGKPKLRTEVESLLRMSTKAACLFPGDTAAEHCVEVAGNESMLGRRVGAYVLREQIGRGGMGSVYRAERADDEFRKSVAVKLIAGVMHSSEAVNRFAVERQILATLEHPNIARLLDAGVTADGFHYIVMEYVEGQPITDYCEARRLSIPEKLRLFHSVSIAVHFAHQHLIVHRDLKPANILVTSDGVPKLLDFGVAKLLNPAVGGHHQTMAAIPMTPSYASPEQARGMLLTTASDVYSLGVILYELVTGRRPYRLAGHGLEEVLEAVCEQEPAKPSMIANELGEKLPRDLDAIVLKALSKAPEERYASAEQFSADIDCYLAGLPVAARGTRWSYRARKFILRHKLALAGCTIGLALTLAGLGGVVWQAHVAEGERALAERRFRDVRDLANSLIFELHDAIKDLPGSTPARKVLVERALHYLDGLSRDAHGDIRLEAELAAAYERLGDVQGYPLYANLGDTTGALASFRKALTIRESLAAQQPGSFEAERSRWADVYRISECLNSLGRQAETAGFYRRELPVAEQYARGRKEADVQEWLAGAYYSAASTLMATGRLNEALDYYQRSAVIREGIADGTAPVDIRTRLAGCYGSIAYVLALEREFHRAMEAQRKAVSIMNDLVTRYPENVKIRHFQALGYFYLGDFLRDDGRSREALRAYSAASQMYQSLSKRDPRDALTGRFLAQSYRGAGVALIDLGRAIEGARYLRKGLAVLESLPKENPENMEMLSAFADSYEGLGAADEAQGSWENALAWYRRSQQIWDDVRRQRGSLHPEDVEKPARLRQRIERCEEAQRRPKSVLGRALIGGVLVA